MTERQVAIRIVRRLRQAGFEALFSGGCVRDLLMRRRPKDYDVATSARPKVVRALFPKTLAIGEAFGVIVVQDADAAVEVATFRAEGDYADGRHPKRVTFCSARKDALRRDFTINGMFYDPLRRRVTDYVGGREDLRRRRIRAIGDANERFREDHLRLLRAVRFASRLGFAIERKTERAIRENAGLIKGVSAERIRGELEAILTNANRGAGFRLMSKVGLLGHILPEVEATKGVEQGPYVHPEGDVFEHTILCLEKLRGTEFRLAMAALLHDIGKPATAQWREGRIRFFGHESLGEKMAGDICGRLRLSRAERERVMWLVKQHMIFCQVRNMRPSTLKKLCAAAGFADVVELYRADAYASGGKPHNYRYVLQKCREFSEKETLKPRPLVTGRDLIRAGLKPGPVFGKILAAVYDLQLDGKLSNKREAMAEARRIAKRNRDAGSTKRSTESSK